MEQINIPSGHELLGRPAMHNLVESLRQESQKAAAFQIPEQFTHCHFSGRSNLTRKAATDANRAEQKGGEEGEGQERRPHGRSAQPRRRRRPRTAWTRRRRIRRRRGWTGTRGRRRQRAARAGPGPGRGWASGLAPTASRRPSPFGNPPPPHLLPLRGSLSCSGRPLLLSAGFQLGDCGGLVVFFCLRGRRDLID
jgi:hypothetical protein